MNEDSANIRYYDQQDALVSLYEDVKDAQSQHSGSFIVSNIASKLKKLIDWDYVYGRARDDHKQTKIPE